MFTRTVGFPSIHSCASLPLCDDDPLGVAFINIAVEADALPFATPGLLATSCQLGEILGLDGLDFPEGSRQRSLNTPLDRPPSRSLALA